MLLKQSVLLLAVLNRLEAQSLVKTKESQIKAAFLVKFMEFVDWPHRRDNFDSVVMRICLVGSEPKAEVIRKFLEIRHQSTATVAVLSTDDVDSRLQCDVLYINALETDNIRTIITKTESLPVVTVSDDIGFAKKGGVIELFVEKRHLGFDVNQRVAAGKGIQISSRLLQLAREVIRE